MKKKIAFLGTAHIHTPDFIRRLLEHPDCEPCGVWDHDAARAAANSQKLGTFVANTPEELCARPDVDAIVICSETNRHESLVKLAASAKKDLYAEKPLGYSAADAVQMASLIKQAGILFQTGYFMRGFPAHQFLKQQIEKGSFGKITRIRHVNCHCGSLKGWFDTEWRWMADPAIAGCGAFGDLGTHSLDIMMWFMGMPEKVTANVHTVTARYGENCDESGEGMLVFPGGAVGTIAGGWVDVMNPVTCEISGTEGFACIQDGKLFFKSNLVEGADGKEPWTDLPEAEPHAYNKFLDAVSGRQVTLVTAEEAAQRSVVMDAMYRGAKTETWIKL